jgi:hypothetical protein
MKILLDIKDSNVEFALKVLKSLSFVKNAEPFSNDALALMDDLRNAVDEVKEHQEGKIELKSAEDFLNEL